ncbi:hypothetical protein, partial [Falsigemmobacter intermedius]|uniref:hypothetical protein n=1 Tax=Falsigemmobacter intermedius TaxID=1553448 RepID=UPI003F0C8B8A
MFFLTRGSIFLCHRGDEDTNRHKDIRSPMSQASTVLKKLVGIGTIVLGIPFLAACSWCLMVKDWHQGTLMEGLSFGILILLLAMPGLLYRP